MGKFFNEFLLGMGKVIDLGSTQHKLMIYKPKRKSFYNDRIEILKDYEKIKLDSKAAIKQALKQ